MLNVSEVGDDLKSITMFHILAFTSVILASCSGTELHPNSRIVQASVSDPWAIPYQVSIEFSHAHRCSGSMVSPTWALTVAHCIKDLDSSELTIRATAPMRNILGQIRNVSFYVLHPKYEPETMDYDIALIRLSEEIAFGNTTNNTVTIATEVPFEGNIARVSGWGSPYPGAWLSPLLTEKNVTIVYFNECQYAYSGINNLVTERMICATSTSGGPCQGDTGDPLVFEEELIGVMAWSYGCGEPKFPTVYTDVTKFRAWVSDYTGLEF
ncbi:Trypsin-2 [Zootermopsis nevadensis]|uniref:Trypsin-2 n=3 Tax=Zootermopsis nevadensis TaxID=136037 RepID=A0A067R4Y9_ZOONE|nr:Trypsin-2 [Zootermopsis nevadensis]